MLTRREPLRAENAHVSVLGHVTLDELGRYLAHVDLSNGFANRFLWCAVRRSKLLPDASTPALDGFRQRLTLMTQAARRIGDVKRTASAASLWRAVYPTLVAEKRGTWDEATSRAEAHVVRLSLLYALLDGSDTIDEPHLRAALALWRYCDESARIVFGDGSGSGSGSGSGTLEGRIRRVVRDRPGIGRTELRDAISHKIKANELERALAWLAGRGELRRESEGGTERLYPLDARQPAIVHGTDTETITPPPTDTVAITRDEFCGSLARARASAKAATATPTPTETETLAATRPPTPQRPRPRIRKRKRCPTTPQRPRPETRKRQRSPPRSPNCWTGGTPTGSRYAAS